MTGPSRNWTTNPVAIFWVVTAVAFTLRLLHILAFSDPAINPTFVMPVTDAGVHHRWAQAILAGTWPGPEPFFRAPLYPYFLAGLYGLLSPESPLTVQIAHGLVSALGAGLAALCALRLWDAKAAWSAGLLYSCLWSSIFFAGELLAVTLSVTLNLLLLWLLLAPVSRRQLLLCGVVLGLSAITRPTILVIIPPVVWYLWQRGGFQTMGRLPGWAWLCLGLLVTIGPVTGRNLIHGGEPVLIAASGGVNFYIGNNQHADGRVAFLPGAPPSWQGEMSDAVTLATTETGQTNSALEADRYFWRQGLTFWQEYPSRALRLTAHKAWLLFASGERSNNKNLAFWRARSALLQWPIWPGWALILGLAVLGFWRSDFDRPERKLILGLVIFYAAALLLFFINARFRLPVLAWLVVPAGGGLTAVLSGVPRRAWPQITRPALLVAVGLATLSFVPDALTYREDPATNFECWRMLGNHYFAIGDHERGLTTWQKALAIDAVNPLPAHRWTLPQIYQPLAQMYRRQRRPQLALDIQRRWVDRLPQSVPARMGLAELLLQEGQATEAMGQLEIVLQKAPDNTEARIGYGWALYRAGHYEKSLAQFKQVNAITENPNARFGQGLSLLGLGRLSAAEAQLVQLLIEQPGFWQAYEHLADIYAQTHQVEQERQIWQRLLAQQPSHQKAKQRLHDLRTADQTTARR